MLEALRAQIDEIDHSIIELLERRTSVVQQVGKLKSEQGAHNGYIRPGREATMIHRLISKAALFPAAAIASMWRVIISASLGVEHDLTIGAYIPTTNRDAYWLSREYFGAFTPVITSHSTAQLLADVIADRITVAVLPLEIAETDELKWWIALVESGSNVRIFAHIPLLQKTSEDQGRFVAMGKAEPEKTGNDTTVLALHADDTMSQDSILHLLVNHGLEAVWLEPSEASSTPGKRYHCIAVKHFIDTHHPAILQLRELMDVTILGAYANPITL
jgi:chorismate mutase/prephenate dehydratase